MTITQRIEARPAKLPDKTPAELAAEWEAERQAAIKAEMTPSRIAARERERQLAEQARIEARKPVGLPPGTKVKVHIWGWRYDPQPAEVVNDNMNPMNRMITAKRLRRGDQEEQVTVRFENVSLWRGQ